MNFIEPPGTELLQFYLGTLLDVVTLSFDLFFPKLGSWWIYVLILKFIDVFSIELLGHKLQFSGLVVGNGRCHGNRFVPHSSGGRPYFSLRVWIWCDHP